jgi:hypothetical protein
VGFVHHRLEVAPSRLSWATLNTLKSNSQLTGMSKAMPYRRSFSRLALMVALLVLSSSGLAFALPEPQFFVPPRQRAGPSTSYNWSGYAVTGPSGSVTDVKGSWKVPVATSTPTDTYSSFWVGIDGYDSNTVEQIGTDSDFLSGSPTYYAWFEFYPKSAYIINIVHIEPGDIISAEVVYSGGRFVVSITNENTSQSFTTSSKVPSAKRSSAEWIAEAPSSGKILPLADFGTAYFGLSYTLVASTCSATVGGATGSIGSFGPSVQEITMVDSSGSPIAEPSPLTSDGTSFSVQRVSSAGEVFDFSVSVSPTSASVARGGSTTATVTVSLLRGTAQAVSLSTSVSPAEMTISTSLLPHSGGPTFTSTLTVGTTAGTPAGTYTVTITATGGGLTRSTSFTLKVRGQKSK